MSQKPIVMEQLKQILQLKTDGIGVREIARRIGVSRNSVRKYLGLLEAERAGTLSDKELADKAYHTAQLEAGALRQQQLHQHFVSAVPELSRTGVTRQLLWQEYLDRHPDGYGYSQYCSRLNDYLKRADVVMHLEYTPADVMMIDFAGKKMFYIDTDTGERIEVEVFVAVLPFCGLIFCTAVHSQQTPDFTTCINEMVLFYRGVAATILCDNFKTAVIRPSKYEPTFTDICYQLSEHYGTTFSATRPYSPRDKAMVEGAVRLVYANVYAPLRDHEFTSLQALNAALQDQLFLLNNKPYKNSPYSRSYFFEQQERPLLKVLPAEPFQPKKVVMLTVQRNYHVQLSEDHHYYSVPYYHVGKKVKVLYDSSHLEIYYDHTRIAVHFRNVNGSYNTIDEHMPPHHRRMKDIRGFSKEDLLEQAARIGTGVEKAAAVMLANSVYIEQNYKACFGMLMLQKKYGAGRLEAACLRALQGTRVNYTMIKNILERGMDRQQSTEQQYLILPDHDNIRGPEHYQ